MKSKKQRNDRPADGKGVQKLTPAQLARRAQLELESSEGEVFIYADPYITAIYGEPAL